MSCRGIGLAFGLDPAISEPLVMVSWKNVFAVPEEATRFRDLDLVRFEIHFVTDLGFWVVIVPIRECCDGVQEHIPHVPRSVIRPSRTIGSGGAGW